MDFDLDKIRELIDLMNSNDLQELEVENGGRKIRLRKSEEAAVREVVAIPTPAAAPIPAAPTEAPSHVVAPGGDNLAHVPSPMVGTFYRAPTPEADPFVEVGDKIQRDTVMCIIEAMKVMNEIRAEMDGVLQEILVANGEAVEFGQPLFVVKRDETD